MSVDTVRIEGLRVTFADGTRALRGVDLAVPASSSVAIVGESGCGKTTLGRALLRLLPQDSTVTGSVRLSGVDLFALPERDMRRIRGRRVGLIAQNPYAACNPLRTVGRTMKEAWLAHRMPVSLAALVARLELLHVADAEHRVRQRPHRWSGGMLQRAGIIGAAVEEPDVLIADEPTSALDSGLADETVRAIRAAAPTILLITHDLELAARHVDTVAVLYAGAVVELGPAREVLAQPRHPYTAALLAALPRTAGRLPEALPGSPPRLRVEPRGCAFVDRCVRRRPACDDIPPALSGHPHAAACHNPLRAEET